MARQTQPPDPARSAALAEIDEVAAQLQELRQMLERPDNITALVMAEVLLGLHGVSEKSAKLVTRLGEGRVLFPDQ
jgi:hypothetical protein